MSDSFAVLDRDEQRQTQTNIKAIPTSQLRPDTLPRSASRVIKVWLEADLICDTLRYSGSYFLGEFWVPT